MAVACASMAWMLAGPVAAAPAPLDAFDRNLIINADAESGAGSPSSDGGVVAVPGWATSGNFTVVEYETELGNPESFPTYQDAGPAERGRNLFVGGPDNSASSARQSVSITSAARLVDLGLVSYSLAGWFGGFAAQDDHALLRATFRRANGQAISSVEVGGVSAADRSNVTGLLPRAAFGRVPEGTRQVEITLTMTKDATFLYNDGYADNLSLVLTNLFGSNLVRNPGAELGAGSIDGFELLDLPGWDTTGNVTVARYDGPDLPASSNSSPTAGANLIAGGPDSAIGIARQSIDVSAGARLIDVGVTSYRVSAWLGGFADQGDHAVVTVSFLGAGGIVLASETIGPVTPDDRDGITSLQLRAASGTVPTGTREILVSLEMTRDGPPETTYNDGYGDDVSVVILP